MILISKQKVDEPIEFSRCRISEVLISAGLICLMLWASAALAKNGDDKPLAGKFCSATAEAQFSGCKNEIKDDAYKAKAICINISNGQERKQCLKKAQAALKEGANLCRAQRKARNQLCNTLGEERYDPDLNPANFDNDFAHLTNPNPYRPLGIGNHWEYVGSGETIVIDVLNKTKLIDSLTCLVVRDVVSINHELHEDTLDWFAQAKNGDVFYCGEEVKDYESFDGDNPREPELIDISGSFKQGLNGDKGGIYFKGKSTVGETYRQEFSAGNAEDVVQVLSTTYSYGSTPELDKFVPSALAKGLCANKDCVVTGEFTPINPAPDGFARKYYAPGIGVFLEVVPSTGKIVQLVECNMDPKCTTLPLP
ncbi:hypothetical protein MCAMS1_01901 [biofilm metagenome]